MNRKRMSGVVIAFLLALSTAKGQSALYTFDGALYPLGANTPFINFPPNTGGIPGFTTDFTSSPTPAGFTIVESVTVPPLPFPGMDGQVLQTGVAVPPQSLILSFSVPVTSITLPFAVNIRPSDPIGRLTITSPTASFSQPSNGGNTSFQGGFITFNDPLGFSTVSIDAFTSTNQPTQFAVDNLQVTAIPEPTTILLTGIGLSGLVPVVWLRLRKRSRRHQRSGSPVQRSLSKQTSDMNVPLSS